MRIGILTLPLHHNYGGILQAYALHTVLQRMGHDAFFILQDKRNPLPLWKYPLVYAKRIVFRYLLGRKDIYIFEEKRRRKQNIIIERNIRHFTDKYIEPHRLNCSFREMRKILDVIVVGSDQIWRPSYAPRIKRSYLSFTKGWKIKRIAYAASFGTDQWEYSQNQTIYCAKLIQKFDAVSVREHSGIELCDKYFNIKAIQLLDPTMLLNEEDYLHIIEGANLPIEKNQILLYYILDETQDKMELVERIAKEKDLTPVRINSKAENAQAPMEERIQPSVEEWLQSFYNAEFIITDSFHACVFSILFNKPFIVYGNRTRGLTRFHSLLKRFGIENQLICELDEYNPSLLIKQATTKHLKTDRDMAMAFLHKNLSHHE